MDLCDRIMSFRRLDDIIKLMASSMQYDFNLETSFISFDNDLKIKILHVLLSEKERIDKGMLNKFISQCNIVERNNDWVNMLFYKLIKDREEIDETNHLTSLEAFQSISNLCSCDDSSNCTKRSSLFWNEDKKSINDVDLNNADAMDVEEKEIKVEEHKDNEMQVVKSFPPELMKRINEWREVIQSIVSSGLMSTDQCVSLTSFLNQITSDYPSFFQDVLLQLPLYQMSDNVVYSLMSSFVTSSLGSVHVSLFLRYVVAPLVSAMNSPASRNFSNVLCDISLNNPECIVDNLIMPILLESNPGSAQCELVTRIIKGKMPADILSDLCFKFLGARNVDYNMSSHSFVQWTEVTLTVLQTLLTKKVLMDQVAIDAAIRRAEIASEKVEISSCIRFSTVLLHLIKNNGPLMMRHKPLVSRILQRASNSMAKTALKALDSL